MATETQADGRGTRWYTDRIGRPATTDEVQGYWIFAVGALLGIAGILLFLPSGPGSSLRELAVVAAATGLAMVFAGPVIRLPLRRRATMLVYLGLLVCGLAVVWFVAAFPRNWSPETGQATIISLYSAGLVLMAIGAVLVPVLSTDRSGGSRRDALRSEIEALRASLLESEADEEDLSRLVADLRETVSDAAADEADLAARVEQLDGAVAETEADEADLAAELRAVRASQARFELYEDRGGEYRWRLRHRNGNTIATGGEGYTRRHDAQRGMQSVRRNALGATVLHVEDEPAPAEPESFEPVEAVDSQAAFELYEDNADEYRFRLRHDNGNILADSSEGYGSRGGAEHALEMLREYVGPADYLRFDPTGIEIYRDAASEWRWRLVHRNGNVLADSGEGYSRRRDARRAVDRVRDGDGLDGEVYEDAAGEYRWRLRSANGQLMADSGEGYADRGGAEDALERVRDHLPDADVLDVGRAAFELYEDAAGEHRWRLRHRNGNILADSGQGYADWSGARDGIERVKRHAPNAPTDS